MIQILFLLISMNSQVIKEIEINVNNLVIQKDAQYTKIRLSGHEASDEVGAPEVPVKAFKIALPYGAKITDIKILSKEFIELDGRFLLSCVQPPVILSRKEIAKETKPRDEIYSSDKPYPENIIEFKNLGLYDNHQICELLVYPVRYLPELQKVIFFNSIRFAIDYEGGVKRMARGDFLKKIVINPEDVTINFAGRERMYFDYLIITKPPMDTVFQRLADWKTKKGIKTEIRTVDWILANYSGEDNAARIRNYLKTLPDSNTQYVLLAGDTDIIPCRFAYAMTCSAGIEPGREDTMPCDLYYADLQGTWDLDGDGSYGEIEDSIDLYPDIFVGRAPVNTIAEVQKFVEKVLIYEKNPELAYPNNALFSADILWLDPYTDQGIHKNQIEQESFPPYFEITKLYHSQGNLSPAAVKNALRQGQGLTNHDGHGWIDVISAGTGYLHNIDFDTLTNAPRYGILISVGCWTTAFDFTSIAESFVNSPDGGGVAFIGNSSYGWGSPGNPGFGYSDRFDSRFFYSLLKENNFRLGTALGLSKAYFIPYSREENVYRWHQYQLNLLGDPEMAVWTDIPETLTVSHPQSIPLGGGRILITVKSKDNNTPIKNALVCLMKGNESYESGYTDASGSIFLNANPLFSGNFALTATAQNYLPCEATIPVISGPYVNYLGWILNDSLGNDDATANPNEDILLGVILKNNGNATSNNIQLKLRSQDPYVSIQDSSESLSSLNINDSVFINNAFRILTGSASNGYCINFELEITDASRTLMYNPIMLISTPVFRTDELIIAEPPSMPGDTESISFAISNTGYGYAHSTYATLSTLDSCVTVLTDSVFCGDIPPETNEIIIGPFSLHISSSIPLGYHPSLFFDIHSEDYNFSDTVKLLIGETGFSDDMESGSDLWTTGGINNLWHISTRKAFSPAHAWYCGDSTGGYYLNDMNCYIQTIPFMINENSLLKFYRWLSVPLYGTDGVYVIIMGNGFADTLDFIGTGGALDGRGIQSDWFEEKYSLADYPAGETIQVRIAFFSDDDGDVGEGFYIDDVNVEHTAMMKEHTPYTLNPVFFEIQPNPFSKKIEIRWTNYDLRSTTIRIYDVSGRLVRSFPISQLTNSPINQLSWSGDDNLGRKLPAGIYFVQLKIPERTLTKKAILLK